MGKHFPDIGKSLPDMGERFPDIGGSLPNMAEHLPDIGERFPNIEQCPLNVERAFFLFAPHFLLAVLRGLRYVEGNDVSGATMSERLAHILLDSFWKILLPGLKMTIPLTAISFALALVIAVAAALVQFARVKYLTGIVRFYIWIMRGTPLLVQLYVVFYGLPNLGVMIDPFPAAVLVFALNEGAYSAETMRAALESVPGGQIEAGYCLGMSYMQIMRRIVLPQAFRTAFPPLSNSLIAMTKDTSLAANITVTEMFMATQRIVARTYEPLALYIEVALIYLLFSTLLTKLQRFGEKRLGRFYAEAGR
ncbi:MAG: amino acid ABC transporter permease [Treponemataceae bacterium]|nr:amino acid ABC transporter permease [Treponemataceae bacterium]